MPLIGKAIILFLIIFNFRIPGLYNSSVLSAILSFIYYISVRKSIPFYYFRQKYIILIFAGLIAINILSIFITISYGTFDYVLSKALILQFSMLCCLVFALPVLLEGHESNAFEHAAAIICYAFVIQSIIQLLGFLIPPFGDFLISIKPEKMQKILSTGAIKIYFRGYALSGSPFFELPAGFGVAFILFFRLLLIDNQKKFTGYWIYIILFLLLFGSVLSGRTAFIGFSMGCIMSILLFSNFLDTIVKIIRKSILPIAVIITIYAFLITPKQRKSLLEDIFPFAFEIFYNYETSGQLTTDSSEAIKNHYFILPPETYLHGDGRFEGENNSYYKNTDAGYMRSVLYGGIPFALCLMLYQSLYFINPLYISRNGNSWEDYADFLCLLALFIHLFFLEYKGLTIGTQNIMQVLLLFIGSSYMARFYYRQQKPV